MDDPTASAQVTGRTLTAASRVVRARSVTVRHEAEQFCRRSNELLGDCRRFVAPSPSPDDRVDVLLAENRRLQQELANMKAALVTRDTIWAAKTIIAASTGCSPDEAQRLLVQQSQHENRKLREIAAEIVDRAARRSAS